MAQVLQWAGQQSDVQKKVMFAMLAIMGVTILFPPKVVISKNPIFDTSTSQPAGYQFIFSDASSDQKAAAEKIFGKDADMLFGSGIEWGKLLLQLVVVGGAG